MRGRGLLLVSVVAALLVTVGTTAALLLVDPKQPKAEAIKTGGLAGGAVVALYALWLNDRRRRTEEARHELESEKVADERFSRAVELLGHEADQVRVGAMHVLAGLADSTPRYKQTVLSVLCAYLRRPFAHASLEEKPEDPDQAYFGDPGRRAAEVSHADDREMTVRMTAQRLVTDLLPWGEDPDGTAYHLDLTGAKLVHFRLEGRRFGRLVARRTQFYGITSARGLELAKPALFSGGTFHGRVDLRDARLHGGVSFQDTSFLGRVDLTGAEVGTFLHVSPLLPEVVGALEVLPGTAMRLDPAGWPLVGDGRPADGRPAVLPDHVQRD
ncbi:pentapeptide repeat-containing protein [Saccharothrix longispora]|uniref:pentapeptide repeat-containing protein n=1 Tax=Saccharothrix longispora TaxID=33920 RepID=UPI0028FD5AFE|nr:pentapeptide repeat-containing protein [Saccharothrix longispora]MBY8847609.1 pentapeptide repeat-containing protein [Saccharothrix sp. MB29]MDU0289648.1 pentapeptide repeat-containing protein [Saccharothrix longispora]